MCGIAGIWNGTMTVEAVEAFFAVPEGGDLDLATRAEMQDLRAASSRL